LRLSGNKDLKGVVAKRKDSLYEPGKRTGILGEDANQSRAEFVIGGFIPGPHGVDSMHRRLLSW